MPSRLSIAATSVAALVTVLVAAGCVTYVDDSGPKKDYMFAGRDWGTNANKTLELRGHQYRARAPRAWRSLHATLARFGLRPLREQGEPQWQISETTYSTQPAGAVRRLLVAARGKFDKRSRKLRARYKVTAALNPATADRTQVAIRVFPEVLVDVDGMRHWQPLPPNGDILKALYKDLDRRMPVYRDKTRAEWKGW